MGRTRGGRDNYGIREGDPNYCRSTAAEPKTNRPQVQQKVQGTQRYCYLRRDIPHDREKCVPCNQKAAPVVGPEQCCTGDKTVSTLAL